MDHEYLQRPTDARSTLRWVRRGGRVMAVQFVESLSKKQWKILGLATRPSGVGRPDGYTKKTIESLLKRGLVYRDAPQFRATEKGHSLIRSRGKAFRESMRLEDWRTGGTD